MKLSQREARWEIGSPISGESCVSVELFEKSTGNKSSLATAPCTEKKQFICEVLDFDQHNFFYVRNILGAT
jgi:hypothetical protein